MKLEFVDALTLAHPFVKGFEQVVYCLNDEEVRAVAQGEISDAIAARKKEDIEGKEGAGPVHSTTFYIGLLIEPKQRKFSLFPPQGYENLLTPGLSSRYHWTSTIRHILSNLRIYQAGQNVGEVRRINDGNSSAPYQEVRSYPVSRFDLTDVQ